MINLFYKLTKLSSIKGLFFVLLLLTVFLFFSFPLALQAETEEQDQRWLHEKSFAQEQLQAQVQGQGYEHSEVEQWSFPSLPSQVPGEERMTGLRPLQPEEWEELEPRIFRITEPQGPRPASSLPAQVKNTRYLPRIRSQGRLSTCAVFATAYYYKTYQEARERGWQNPDPATHPERIASPTWAYNLAPRGGYSIGVNHFQVAQRICDFGIASWEEMPYDPNNYDYSAWPDEEIWKRAAEWRGEEVGSIAHNTPDGLLALKEHLAGGDLAVVGVPVYENFDYYPSAQFTDNNVLYDNYETEEGYRGGHAMTVVGYDDDIEYYDQVAEEYKQGALLLVNSWGTNWGITEPDLGMENNLETRGFIWIAYDYFLEDLDDWGANTDALIMTDRIGHQPEKFALIGIDHTNGRQLFIDVKGGEYDDPAWERPGIPHANPGELYVEEHGYIAVDLTDYQDHETVSYYLSVRQAAAQWGGDLTEQLGGEGEITYFAIQAGDSPSFIDSPSLMESPDVPQNTALGEYEPYRDFSFRVGLLNEAGITFDDLKLRRGGVAWADFSGNGYPDLLATGYDYTYGRPSNAGLNLTKLYVNQGDGIFAPGVKGDLPQLFNSLVAAADYNNNGYPNLALSGRGENVFDHVAGVYKNNGDNTFTSIDVDLPEDIESLNWIDHNNNGRMDLAVGTPNHLTIFKNTGLDTFEPLPPIIDVSEYEEGEYEGEGKLNLAVAWGDYNGNGLIDLAVLGEYYRGPYNRPTRKPLSTIYKNLGDGTYNDIEVDLPVLNGADLAWGDYNKNGLLDLAVTGYTDRPRDPMEGVTAVYRNNGDDTFTDIEASLGQAWNGNVAWGDMNNNGWLDLVVTGQDDYMYSNSRRFLLDNIPSYLFPYPEHVYDHRALIFLNDREGSFKEAGGGLPRASIAWDYNPAYSQTNYNNALALVDYNQSGSLDLFLSGTRSILFETQPEWIYTGIYRNDVGELLNRPNTPPCPPEIMGARKGSKQCSVILEWEPGSDAETPGEGLYYNLRVGTSPGAGDIISGVNGGAAISGENLLPGRKYQLNGLCEGTYYWSVQTMDACYTPSAWSEEQVFETEGLSRMGDVTGSGSVTIADAILVLRHVSGLIDLNDYSPEALTRAKVSEDGESLNIKDAVMILHYIVGLTDGL